MEPSIFRATEILDMAVEIERQGVVFYRTARETAIPRVKDVLDFLIEQEEQHEQTFLRMKQGADKDFFLPESYAGERENYINSFVKDQVFFDPVKAVQQFEGVADVLETIRIAIEYEWRSILFYSWIRQIVRVSENQVMDRIISEEHLHISKLLKLRQEVDEIQT